MKRETASPARQRPTRTQAAPDRSADRVPETAVVATPTSEPVAVRHLQRQAGNRAVAGLLADSGGAPVSVQRWKPPVTTPSFPPRPLPPASYRATNPLVDAEGNPIAVSGAGKPYLSERPRDLAFPHAGGNDHRLFPVNPNRSYRLLRQKCGALLKEQRALAKRLKGSPNYWFARVYGYVTQFTLADVDAGKYQYPHMKMQQIVLFHETYERNLSAWESGARHLVEANWLAAFGAAADSDSWLGASKSIGNALLPAMESHIRLDLPRAIAAAYRMHYHHVPGTSLDDFRPDFFGMDSVFARSQAALAPEIEAAGTDWNPVNWESLGDAGFIFLFQIDAERQMAWQKAVQIARVWGLPRATIERALRADMGARHPNREPFEVDGTDIRSYDWGSQPGARPDAGVPRPQHESAPEPPAVGTLHFKLDRPRGGELLEHAVRRDQDLEPLLRLADWTREVTGASIVLVGRASSEGPEVLNQGLGTARAELVKFFLFRAGADLDRNRVRTISLGEFAAQRGPDDRTVSILLLNHGRSKQQFNPAVGNVPSEVAP